VGRSEAASDGAQPGLPLAYVMKKGSPDQVAPERLLPCDMSRSINTMALVIWWLGKESLSLER
jgi:hypothetical protein